MTLQYQGETTDKLRRGSAKAIVHLLIARIAAAGACIPRRPGASTGPPPTGEEGSLSCASDVDRWRYAHLLARGAASAAHAASLRARSSLKSWRCRACSLSSVAPLSDTSSHS